MGDFRRHPSRKAWLFLLSATTCLTSGAALAQPPLTNYIAIQPIDVCASNGTGCAPVNSKGQTVLNGPNTPIGFADPTTGTDLTGAMWNQIGIALAFSPIVQYKSPANVSTGGPPCGLTYNTDFRTLHVVQIPDPKPNAPQGSTIFQSCDFLTLSQQPGISQGAAPTPPLAPQPLMVNLFFVNTLVPPSPGQLYGFSWKNGNGMSIAMNTLRGVPLLGLPPRPDTIAHELGHNLDIDHDTFRAGPAVNLLTAGNVRFEPTVANALPDLNNGTADQLNSDQQKPHVFLSNFIMNPIASSTVTATKTATPTATATATVTAAGITLSGGAATAAASAKPDTSIFFDAFGPDPATDRPGETLVQLIVKLGRAVQFDPGNRVQFLLNGSFVKDFDYQCPGGGGEEDSDAFAQCLVIDLKGLPESADLKFKQGIIRTSGGEDQQGDNQGNFGNGKLPVTLKQLAAAGVRVTFKFSDGLSITSALSGSDPMLTANSQNPITTGGTRPHIDPAVYTPPPGAVGGACTPVAGATGGIGAFAGVTGGSGSHCPSPALTGGADGNPAEEGGQPGPIGGAAPR